MEEFIGKDFMLQSDAARELYHESAENMPIIDYHCHLIPQMIADNYKFRDLTEIWLGGDHYKWRQMRGNGVGEEYLTGGTKSSWETFEKWAATMPYLMRNPLYHWTQLELARVFGIYKILKPETAREIFEECNAKLATPEFRGQALIRGITYPLTPSQITLISTFTIGLPAFLLSQVPDHFMIKGKFAQNVVQRALPGALTDLIVVMAMVTFGKIFEVSQAEITTASTLLLSIVGFLFLRHICKPHTSFKSAVRLLCIAGLMVAFRIFDSVFDLEPLSTQGWLLTINFGIMADTFMRFIRYLLYNAEKMLLKMNIAKKESGNFV